MTSAFTQSIIALKEHGVKCVPACPLPEHAQFTRLSYLECRQPGAAHTAHNGAVREYAQASKLKPDCGGRGSAVGYVRAKTFYADPVCSNAM